MASPHTGHGRNASRDVTTAALTAARSDCESEEASCIAFASFVGRRASIAQVVRWSGKVFTRSQGPAFERPHNTCTRRPRHPAPFSVQCTTACSSAARGTLRAISSCGRCAATEWRVDGRVFPAIIPASSGGGVAADALWVIATRHPWQSGSLAPGFPPLDHPGRSTDANSIGSQDRTHARGGAGPVDCGARQRGVGPGPAGVVRSQGEVHRCRRPAAG
jgi:hypothetical protein